MTLHDIGYNAFALEVADSRVAFPVLTLKGSTADYNALSVQLDVFRRDSNFENIVLEEITETVEGEINFTVSMELHPSLISYSQEYE